MRLLRLIGKPPKVRSSRAAVRWLFLRVLGAVYLIAFTSLRVQVLGLYGSRGIRPIRELLAALRAQAGRHAYRLAPSLLWLGAADRDLVRLCRTGQLCSLALLAGVAPGVMSVATWALYLSFVSVGRDFLSFQWDALLLETGLHATLVATSQSARGARMGQPRWLASVLLRWLVFRLHFQSGFVKLRSQDETWRRCTACAYHYETQPLPTRLGWYAHHLPRPVHRVSTAATLAIELGAPFLVFAPRPARKLGFSALAGLQALIAATGNYAFFNVLTVALTAWMLDDDSFHVLHRLVRVSRRPARRRRGAALARACGRMIYGALSPLLAVASTVTFIAHLRRRPLPMRLTALNQLIDPFRSVNPYGLFAAMTTARSEIVVEGSNDGAAWREYPFRYKPSRPEDAPRTVAPHQPRLDWQMWFAALRPPPTWFGAFLGRLLEGSPDVLKLLKANPFPDHPPRYVRALLYEYRTTDLETKRRTGAWWRRDLIGTYFPICTLRRKPGEVIRS